MSLPEKAAGAGLPYGVVMATGGASHLARACGVPSLAEALLWLAIAQAVWILGLGLRRHWYRFVKWPIKWVAIQSPERLSGYLTIPLGLAVIESELATLASAGGVSVPAVIAGLVLVWLTTCVCVGRFVVSLVAIKPCLDRLDGTWFLAPAVLLGATIATIDTLPVTASHARWLLAGLAEVAALSGLVGYWVVLGLAFRRIVRAGFAGAPRAPWWIAMGCAGLAVAALSSVQKAAHMPWESALHVPLNVAMLITFAAALVQLVPTVGLSLDFLCRHCRFTNRAVWPPTFSTAVFAMGCLGLGSTLQIGPVVDLGLIAGWVTLVLWGLSGTWNIALKIRHARYVMGTR